MTTLSAFSAFQQIGTTSNSHAPFMVRLSGTTWVALCVENTPACVCRRTTDDWSSISTTKTWSSLVIVSTAGSVALSPYVGGTLLMGCRVNDGGGGGDRTEVWRSTDGGSNWTKSQNIDVGGIGNQLMCIAQLGGNWWLGTATGLAVGHLWKSVDDGVTWTDQGQLSTETTVWDLMDLGGGTWLAGGAADIWRTTNSGASWTSVQSFTPNTTHFPKNRNSALFRNTSTGTVYALTAKLSSADNVYRSTDSGATWSLLSSGTAMRGFGAMLFSGSNAFIGRGQSSSAVLPALGEDDLVTLPTTDFSPQVDGQGVLSMDYRDGNGSFLASVGNSGTGTTSQLYSCTITTPVAAGDTHAFAWIG